jgi:hypothetical protein
LATEESSKEFLRVLEVIRITGDSIPELIQEKSCVRGVPGVLRGAVG